MIRSLKRYRRCVTAEKILASKPFQDNLQLVLLKIHLSLVDILGPQQLSKTNDLGGYTPGSPCEPVPTGYSTKLELIYMNCN